MIKTKKEQCNVAENNKQTIAKQQVDCKPIIQLLKQNMFSPHLPYLRGRLRAGSSVQYEHVCHLTETITKSSSSFVSSRQACLLLIITSLVKKLEH